MIIRVPWVIDLEPLRVAVMPRPHGGELLEISMQALRQQGVDVLVSMLEYEEQEMFELVAQGAHCAAVGIDYLNVPVRDRGVPRSPRALLPHAKKLAEDLKAGKGVAFHCFAGIGRSPLMAACTLALLGWTPEKSFAAISKTRGLEVPDTDEQLKFAQGFARSMRAG